MSSHQIGLFRLLFNRLLIFLNHFGNFIAITSSHEPILTRTWCLISWIIFATWSLDFPLTVFPLTAVISSPDIIPPSMAAGVLSKTCFVLWKTWRKFVSLLWLVKKLTTVFFHNDTEAYLHKLKQSIFKLLNRLKTWEILEIWIQVDCFTFQLTVNCWAHLHYVETWAIRRPSSDADADQILGVLFQANGAGSDCHPASVFPRVERAVRAVAATSGSGRWRRWRHGAGSAGRRRRGRRSASWFLPGALVLVVVVSVVGATSWNGIVSTAALGHSSQLQRMNERTFDQILRDGGNCFIWHWEIQMSISCAEWR